MGERTGAPVRPGDPGVGRTLRSARGFRHWFRRRGLRARAPDCDRGAADSRVHARYRPAVPGDLRVVAAARAPVRRRTSAACSRRSRSRNRRRGTATRCGSASPIGAAAFARWRRFSRSSPVLMHGSPRFAVTRPPIAPDAAIVVREARQRAPEDQSARRLDDRRRLGVHPRERRALQPAVRPRLREHRVRTVHDGRRRAAKTPGPDAGAGARRPSAACTWPPGRVRLQLFLPAVKEHERVVLPFCRMAAR